MLSILVLSCFLAACVLESKPEPQQPQIRTDFPAFVEDSVMGHWLEKMPENEFYFAGYKLELNFGRDSIELRLHHWTDVIACSNENGVTQCDNGTWIDTYRGTWALQDSILRIECRQILAGNSQRVDTTLRQVTYRLTSERGETMSLAHQGRAGDFLAIRMNILLQRVNNLPEQR